MYTFLFLCLCLICYFPLLAGKKELPSFVKVCKRNDPKLDECVTSSIEGLKPYLGKGVPIMRIPPFDPLIVTKLVIDNGNVHFEYDDMKFSKLDRFEIDKYHLDFDTCYSLMEIRHEIMPITGQYKVKGKLLAFELQGEGLFEANCSSVRMFAQMNCTRELRKGKEYFKFTDINFRLRIGGYKIRLHDLFRNNPELTDRTNAVLNENSESLVGEFQELVEKAVEKIVMSTVQGVYDSFPLEILLPE